MITKTTIFYMQLCHKDLLFYKTQLCFLLHALESWVWELLLSSEGRAGSKGRPSPVGCNKLTGFKPTLKAGVPVMHVITIALHY